MAIQAPKGFEDLLPGAEYGWKDTNRWHHLEELFRQVAQQYGYQEYRPPLVEFTDLFVHGVGTTSDIVTKEMLNIVPRGDAPDPRRMTMRPEFTAGLARLWAPWAWTTWQTPASCAALTTTPRRSLRFSTPSWAPSPPCGAAADMMV